MPPLRCFKPSSEEAATESSVQNFHLDWLQGIQESPFLDLLDRRRLHILGLLPTIIPCHRMGWTWEIQRHKDRVVLDHGQRVGHKAESFGIALLPDIPQMQHYWALEQCGCRKCQVRLSWNRKAKTDVSQMVQSCHGPRCQLLRRRSSSLSTMATRSTGEPRHCVLRPIWSSWRLYVRLAGIWCCLYSSKTAWWFTRGLDRDYVGLEFGFCFDRATYCGTARQALCNWLCWVLDRGESSCGWDADIDGNMDETPGG